jgi:CRISPR-associated protein Cas2
MLVLITYDVNTETPGGQKRLRHVAKVCENFGQRVQKSVFECLIDPAQLAAMRQKLLKEIDLGEDSLRFYFLGKNWKPRIEHVGTNKPYDPEGLLIT